MPSQMGSVTTLLRQWSSGDLTARDKVIPLIYDQLHKLAAGCMRGERPEHTLKATALVHEAYLRLVNSDLDIEDRVQFFSVCASLMRRILVDHARSLHCAKRGQRSDKLPFDEAIFLRPPVNPRLIELDDSLKELAVRDQRKSDIVEMIYFGGMTYDETARALRTSESTVHRELKMAKAWLNRELSRNRAYAEAAE